MRTFDSHRPSRFTENPLKAAKSTRASRHRSTSPQMLSFPFRRTSGSAEHGGRAGRAPKRLGCWRSSASTVSLAVQKRMCGTGIDGDRGSWHSPYTMTAELLSEQSRAIYEAALNQAKKELIDALDQRADLHCRADKLRNKLLSMAQDSSLPRELREDALNAYRDSDPNPRRRPNRESQRSARGGNADRPWRLRQFNPTTAGKESHDH